MLTEIEKLWISDFLKDWELVDLIELAKTSTNGIIRPSSIDECLNAILLHTTDIKSLLMRRKITKSLLFKYLHSKNFSFPGQIDKEELTLLVIDFWEKNFSNVEVVRQTVQAPQTELDQSLKTLAVKFSEWFYNRVNTLVMQNMNNRNDSERLMEEDFWNNATFSVKLMQSSGEPISDFSSEGSKECLELLYHVCTSHSLVFSPNLGEEGTRGTKDPHGLVLVLNCGTLHSAKNGDCVGLYEQVFGLIKDPLISHNWKIKVSKLILRSQEVTSSPRLTWANELTSC